MPDETTTKSVALKVNGHSCRRQAGSDERSIERPLPHETTMNTVSLNVNGRAYRVEVRPEERLLDLLRDRLGLTGTKEGCGIGELGDELTAPAIGNALFHATGKRQRDLPFNLERVLLGKPLGRQA